jgi:hypothetical protein
MLPFHPDIPRPSTDFVSLTTIVASTRNVIPPYILHPHSNYNYLTTVFLPRLQCQNTTISQLGWNETDFSAWAAMVLGDSQDQPASTFNLSDLSFVFNGSNYNQFLYLAMAKLSHPKPELTTDAPKAGSPSTTGRIYIASYTGALNLLECITFNSSFDLEVTVKNNVSTISAKELKDIKDTNQVWPVGYDWMDDYSRDKVNVQVWFAQLCSSILGYATNGSNAQRNIEGTILARSRDYQATRHTHRALGNLLVK